MMRLRFDVESVEELRECADGSGEGEVVSSSSRLRFVRRWGGSCGPTDDILFAQYLVSKVCEATVAELYRKRFTI